MRPGQQILDTETKQITHVIRAGAFNTQATLATTVRTDTGYRRGDDEAHTLIRTALNTTGDIDPDRDAGVLHVRLDPLPTPRATTATSELCGALNRAKTVFPDTNLKWTIRSKPAPDHQTILALSPESCSCGTMPISGLPGKPTTQGKNERSHQTLIRFLDAHRLSSLDQVRSLITRYREHYNNRRPHQSLSQATPRQAWDLLEHTPATEPIPLVALEAKAAEYRQARNIRTLDRASITMTKTGQILPDDITGDGPGRAADQLLVEVSRANRQVYYQGFHISLPTTFGGRQFYRTITDAEFLLADPATGEIVFSLPLPMVALQASGRYVPSYSVRGVNMAHPTKQWQNKHDQFAAAMKQRELGLPALFDA